MPAPQPLATIIAGTSALSQPARRCFAMTSKNEEGSSVDISSSDLLIIIVFIIVVVAVFQKLEQLLALVFQLDALLTSICCLGRPV